LPRSVDGPWDWPPLERTHRLSPHAPVALTVTPAWGVSAAPTRPVAFGRGGPWEEEVRDIEAAYGADRVLHVSLEEFARTLSTARENRERLREGGVPARALGRRLRAAHRAGEVERFRTAFAQFRAFDRPDVLHLFATFRPDPAFAREFPAAVQTGPLWPRKYRRVKRPSRRGRRVEWVWYASPVSAQRLVDDIVAGLGALDSPPHLLIVTPRPWTALVPRDRVEVVSRPLSSAEWEARFASAALRIVTGSRTLLEAMELGGPFLYFNGVLGRGAGTRRHRPEKLRAVLELAARQHAPESLRRDLADFARGRRVREVVATAASGTRGWDRFPVRWSRGGFPPPFDDAGELLVRVASALGRPGARASEIVRRVRAGQDPSALRPLER
jgi:hypothetical protein